METAGQIIGYPSRTLRRLLIVSAYAIPLVVLGTGRYTSETFDVWTFLLGVSLLILLWLIAFSSRALNIGSEQDERQRGLGMQALTVTYIFIAPLAIGSALLYRYGSAGSTLFEFCLFSLFYLTGFLPATIVTWLEPDSVRPERGDL